MKQNGFTLIELSLAMTLFIIVLVVFTIGFIGISRTFTRGVIRKQLSQGVQETTDTLSKAIRTSNVKSLPVNCTGSSPPASCSSSISPTTWQGLCFGTGRYFWHVSLGGLYQDFKSCNSTIVSADGIELLSTRYLVDALEINTLSASTTVAATSLYEVKGVFRTKDTNAFIFDTTPPIDPYITRCKGTSQSNTVFSCAIEKFSFIINSRGATS